MLPSVVYVNGVHMWHVAPTTFITREGPLLQHNLTCKATASHFLERITAQPQVSCACKQASQAATGGSLLVDVDHDRTGPPRHVMRFHVHLKRLDVHKVSLTHLTRRSGPHRLVFSGHVLFEVQLAGEALAALGAVEGTFARVLAHVRLQTSKLGKAPGAHLTLVGMLTRVCLDVRCQCGGRGELLRANLTVELALLRVLLTVRGQVGGRGKTQRAQLTLVRLLTRVGADVAHQSVVECEGPVADGAHVRPLPRVYLHVRIQRRGGIETLLTDAARVGPLLGM